MVDRTNVKQWKRENVANGMRETVREALSVRWDAEQGKKIVDICWLRRPVRCVMKPSVRCLCKQARRRLQQEPPGARQPTSFLKLAMHLDHRKGVRRSCESSTRSTRGLHHALTRLARLPAVKSPPGQRPCCPFTPLSNLPCRDHFVRLRRNGIG